MVDGSFHVIGPYYIVHNVSDVNHSVYNNFVFALMGAKFLLFLNEPHQPGGTTEAVPQWGTSVSASRVLNSRFSFKGQVQWFDFE